MDHRANDSGIGSTGEQDAGGGSSHARQVELLEAIGRLAGGVAHDFNNLLTSILGYAELLDDQLRVRGNARAERSDLKEIRVAAERARELTLRLLAFARRMPVSPRVVDANQLIVGVERIVRRVVNERVTVALELDANTGLVVADPTQLEQLVLSLAVNGADAMPDGGTLTIAARPRDLALDGIPEGVVIGGKVHSSGLYMELAVTDKGRGMPENFLHRAFQPYVTTKADTVGAGLGLPAVLGLVTQASGVVIVNSELGRGTSVHVLLPRAHDDEATGESTPVPATSGGHEMILLAEDDASVREMNVRALQNAGYIVHAAEDGAAAIALAQGAAMNFDLLVTDVVMPHKNGWEVVAAIRAQRPDAKVMIVSGLPPETHAPPKLPERGYAFMAKPFKPAALLSRVRQLLDAAPPRTPSNR